MRAGIQVKEPGDDWQKMADNDSSGKRLNTRQRRFVTAMLTASSIGEAAELAGIGERTAYRYLADPEVKLALARAFDGALAQATRHVVGAMTEAVATLAAIHTNPNAPTGARVSAARAILDAGPRLREAVDIAERVTQLEQKLSEDS